MFDNGFWKSLRSTVLASTMVMASISASAQSQFTLVGSPIVGSTFTLEWNDLGVDSLTGFTDTDIIVAFNPAMLEQISVTPGSAFGESTVFSESTTLEDVNGDPIYVDWDVQWHIVQRNADQSPYGTDILSLEFKAVAAGPTSVLLLGWFTPTEALQIPGYYAFVPGFDVAVDVSPIPEPATLALMLAGLGLVAGVASRRRGAARRGA